MTQTTPEKQKNNIYFAWNIRWIIYFVCGEDINTPPAIFSDDPDYFDGKEDEWLLNDSRIISLYKPYHDYRSGKLSEDNFLDLFYQTALSFRNDAMRHERAVMRAYTEDEIIEAERHAPEYRELSHKIIRWKLGYIPDLPYSAIDQHSIRYLLAVQQIDRPYESISKLTRFSLVKTNISQMHYRETFVKEGWEAADKLPLIWFDKEEVKKKLHEMNVDYSHFQSPT